jgi:2-methylcitrate dehydratase PrpD
MEPEQKLASYVSSTRYEDLPASAIAIIKTVVLTNLGGALGGAFVDGCQQAVEVAREWGARPEATLWVHGGKVSAHDAAFANSIMARALDLDDIMQPGIHIGASAVPVALALAEKMGGCSAVTSRPSGAVSSMRASRPQPLAAGPAGPAHRHHRHAGRSGRCARPDPLDAAGLRPV